MRVLVRPPYPSFLENKMFEYSASTNNRWIEPYVRWRELGAERNVEICTWDRYPLDSADLVLFMDLPNSRAELTKARAAAPQAQFILMLVESPLGRPHAFHQANHEGFAAIATYNWRLCDQPKYHRYYLPIGTAPTPADPSYADRKPLVMINSNRLLGPLGLFAFRQPGLGGLPGIGWLFKDWKIGTRLLGVTRGELYSRRRAMARLAEAEFPGLLEIYGPGWGGEPCGWIHKFVKPRPFASSIGCNVVQKDELLTRYRFGVAFENMVGDVGYISEKIFDTLAAGVVPLYLGDEQIAEHVDPACYVDARQFAGDRELLSFVRDCPESEWRSRREAGQRYLASDAAKKFQSRAFAERMMDIVEKVVPIPR